MTPNAEEQSPQPLTIQEMARQSGISEHTLRYYERIGLIANVPRDGNGHRRYPPDLVLLVETLTCLRGTGLSMDSIRRYLHQREQGASAAAQQKALFVAHHEALEKEVALLQQRLQYVAGKIAYWEAVEAGNTTRANEIRDTICQLARSLNKQGEAK